MQRQEQLDGQQLTQEELKSLNLVVDERYPGLYKFEGLRPWVWVEAVRVYKLQHLSSAMLKKLRALPTPQLESVRASDSGHFFSESDEDGRLTGRLMYLTRDAMEELIHSN